MDVRRPDLLTSNGLDGLSLVGIPAIEEDFVAFSKGEDSLEVYLSSDEKMQVVGPMLIPDKLIPRKDKEGHLFSLVFTAQDIVDVQHLTAKKAYKHDMTIGHSTYTDGVYVLESWIKESENDKSADYGYGHLPVGTMFAKAQVTDPVVWNGIKNGELNGFSIEMYTKLKDIEMSKEETPVKTTEEKKTAEVNLEAVLEAISGMGAILEELKSESKANAEKIEEVSVEMAKITVGKEEAKEEAEKETEEKLNEATEEEKPREGVELSAEEQKEKEAAEELALEKELLEEQEGKKEEKEKEPVMLSYTEASRIFKERFGL